MKIVEVWAETGESVLRDATPEELQQAEKDAIAEQVRKDSALAKAELRKQIFSKLGLTEAEAKLLLA
jgi:hypothetical protein